MRNSVRFLVCESVDRVSSADWITRSSFESRLCKISRKKELTIPNNERVFVSASQNWTQLVRDSRISHTGGRPINERPTNLPYTLTISRSIRFSECFGCRPYHGFDEWSLNTNLERNVSRVRRSYPGLYLWIWSGPRGSDERSIRQRSLRSSTFSEPSEFWIWRESKWSPR
jgi:hypothetical protein